MSKSEIVITTMLLASLSGCYTIHTQQSISELSDNDLCQNARVVKNTELALAEISKRGLIEDRDLKHLNPKTLRAGMSECALIAMHGYPNDGWIYCGSINSSGGVYGSRKQWVYDACGGSNFAKTFYIYTEDGIITSWQNY